MGTDYYPEYKDNKILTQFANICSFHTFYQIPESKGVTMTKRRQLPTAGQGPGPVSAANGREAARLHLKDTHPLEPSVRNAPLIIIAILLAPVVNVTSFHPTRCSPPIRRVGTSESAPSLPGPVFASWGPLGTPDGTSENDVEAMRKKHGGVLETSRHVPPFERRGRGRVRRGDREEADIWPHIKSTIYRSLDFIFAAVKTEKETDPRQPITGGVRRRGGEAFCPTARDLGFVVMGRGLFRGRS